MKSDSEEFCKDAFDKYLRRITPTSSLVWCDVEQRDEPPDFYLSVNGATYAVEVTAMKLKVSVGAKKLLPVRIVVDLLQKFVDDEVEGVARNSGYLQGSYLVGFSKPITNFAAVKGMIQGELLAYISGTQTASKVPASVVFKNNREECRIEKSGTAKDKVIMEGLVVSGWPEALAEAKQVLADRLSEKERRLRHIRDAKILLLHNQYYLADLNAYAACISELTSLHAFHTVFVAESGTAGKILYSREPTWA